MFLVVGIFFVGYALFQVPLTAGVERFGGPAWLMGISLTWGLLTASLALVRGPISFYVIRFLLGVAESSTYPTMWHQLSLFFAPNEMSSAYSRVCSCSTVAQVVGAPLAAIILGFNGLFGVRGWQWLFLFGGAVLLVIEYGWRSQECAVCLVLDSHKASSIALNIQAPLPCCMPSPCPHDCQGTQSRPIF